MCFTEGRTHSLGEVDFVRGVPTEPPGRDRLSATEKNAVCCCCVWSYTTAAVCSRKLGCLSEGVSYLLSAPPVKVGLVRLCGHVIQCLDQQQQVVGPDVDTSLVVGGWRLMLKKHPSPGTENHVGSFRFHISIIVMSCSSFSVYLPSLVTHNISLDIADHEGYGGAHSRPDAFDCYRGHS